jgi:putative transposase
MKYFAKLLPDSHYHVFGRAIGSEKLFRSDWDYRRFLLQYHAYMDPVAVTYGFALLPNHYHFLLRTKSTEEILIEPQLPPLTSKDLYQGRFADFFNSYVKTYNRKYDRKGGLFISPFRRVRITTYEQLCRALFYVHKNPVHHGCCRDMAEWEWSSYAGYLSGKPGPEALEAMAWFGGETGFREYHAEEIILKYNPASQWLAG